MLYIQHHFLCNINYVVVAECMGKNPLSIVQQLIMPSGSKLMMQVSNVLPVFFLPFLVGSGGLGVACGGPNTGVIAASLIAVLFILASLSKYQEAS